MIVRELLRFRFVYHEGTVTLIDKKKGISFDLPITYLDSFTRAGIAFKNAHRNELATKQHSRTQKQISRLKERLAKKKRKVTIKVEAHYGEFKND